MKNLMTPIDAPNGVFVDGNPITGAVGTRVTALWLNAIQEATIAVQGELIKVLQTAGIAVDGTTAPGQFLAALNALYAGVASPNLMGTPTAPTAAPGTNTQQLATTAFVQAALATLLGGAPGALDTLKELADALGDDANFAANITNALALKAPLLSPLFTGTPRGPTAGPGTNTTQFATTEFVQAALANAASVPAGAIGYFAMNAAPTGWLKANGALVSRTTYAALFTAIGTAFGAGDGATTFALPDLRGEFLRGWDDGRGVDASRALGSLQAAQNAAHSHTGTTDAVGNHTHGTYLWGSAQYGSLYGGSANNPQYSGETAAAGAHNHTFTTAASGGNEARPRNIALLACIKY